MKRCCRESRVSRKWHIRQTARPRLRNLFLQNERTFFQNEAHAHVKEYSVPCSVPGFVLPSAANRPEYYATFLSTS